MPQRRAFEKKGRQLLTQFDKHNYIKLGKILSCQSTTTTDKIHKKTEIYNKIIR